MNPLSMVNILLHAGAAVPGMQAELSKALTENWSKSIVQDFAQGVDILSSVVKDVAASFEPSASGIEMLTPAPPMFSPATPAEVAAAQPPTSVHSDAEIEAAKAIIAAATAQGQLPPAS